MCCVGSPHHQSVPSNAPPFVRLYVSLKRLLGARRRRRCRGPLAPSRAFHMADGGVEIEHALLAVWAVQVWTDVTLLLCCLHC